MSDRFYNSASLMPAAFGEVVSGVSPDVDDGKVRYTKHTIGSEAQEHFEITTKGRVRTFLNKAELRQKETNDLDGID